MFVTANIERKNEKNNIKTKKYLFFQCGLARNLPVLERVMRGQRNPKGFPSGEQQTNMIMDCVSQESPS